MTLKIAISLRIGIGETMQMILQLRTLTSTQQIRGFLVLPPHRQSSQLFQRRYQHNKSFKSGHSIGEILLRVVQELDITAEFLHEGLGVLGIFFSKISRMDSDTEIVLILSSIFKMDKIESHPIGTIT